MKLRDLDAQFYQWYKGIADEFHGQTLPDGTTQWGGFPVDCFKPVDTLAEAHCVWLLCPKCFAANNGKAGTHQVCVYFKGSPVPDVINQGVRWDVSGAGLDDLTISPSILCIGGCAWHGFITNGDTRDA